MIRSFPRWLALVLTATYVVALTAGSLLPSGTEQAGGWDSSISPTLQNALHAPAYAGLLVLATLSLPMSARVSPGALLGTALACIALGGVLELAQALVPGRAADPLDAVLNGAGVVLGVLAVLIWARATRAPAQENHGHAWESGDQAP